MSQLFLVGHPRFARIARLLCLLVVVVLFGLASSDSSGCNPLSGSSCSHSRSLGDSVTDGSVCSSLASSAGCTSYKLDLANGCTGCGCP